MSNRLAAALTLGYAVLADLVAPRGLPPALAVVCLAPLVLFAPGYAFILAFGLQRDAGFPGRLVVLAVALSMGCAVLGGLIINALAPLDQSSWSGLLVGVTCALAIAALAKDIHDGGRFSIARPRVPHEWRAAVSWPAVVLAAVIMLAVAGAVVVTETSSHNAYNKPVTQLSLLPVQGSAGQSLRVTVANLSGLAERVTLTVTRGGGPPEATLLVIPASRNWSRVEPVASGGVQAALTRPGRQQPLSEVEWNG